MLISLAKKLKLHEIFLIHTVYVLKTPKKHKPFSTTFKGIISHFQQFSSHSAISLLFSGRLDMEVYSEGEFSTVQVNVRFVRRYGFYLLTLYIPTTLLMVIAYATFFFNSDDFNSRIVVALTALLVLASLFTQVLFCLVMNTKFACCTCSLSSESYINHSILFFFFCLCSYMFLCVLLSIPATDLQLTAQDIILQAG